MKFALFTHLSWPEGIEPRQVIEESVEQVQFGEQLGFYSAWFAEHHFSRYSIGSSALVIATSVAARTSTIRLGTGVLVPTLQHPIRLAEDTATVDLVSGGRLDVGFGRGTFGYEYDGFGVDPEESQSRFQESIRIVQGLWTTPDFTYEGEHFQIKRANLVPPPLQKPHPPIYIAATRSPDTLDFLVASGHRLCIAVVQDTQDGLDLCHRFVKKSAEAGTGVPMSEIPFFRYVYVAATEKEAREDTEGKLNWVVDIMQWRRTFQEGSEVYQKMDDWRRSRIELPMSYDTLYENRAIIGTPEQCVAKIRDLQGHGVEYFGCNFHFGGMEHHKAMRSMQLFADEVMPRLA